MSDPGRILTSLTASSIFDLRGVVAVVTGGGTGIGLMISSTLMANGATVYIVGPDQKKLDLVAENYNKAAAGQEGKGKLVGLEVDVRSKNDVKRLADEIARREPHVTVLFNNAGVLEGALSDPPVAPAPIASLDAADPPLAPDVLAAQYAARYWATTEAEFDNTLRTNAVAPYFVSAAFLPLLGRWAASEGGKRFAPQIVMTSSMNGWTKDVDTGGRSFPYLFSKSAVGHFTSSLAHDLLPLGVRVNGIAPGWFVTEMTAPGTMDAAGVSHASAANVLFDIPVRAAPGSTPHVGGTARDMGALALFLVANWYVNGETVLIDGGTLLRHPSSY